MRPSDGGRDPVSNGGNTWHFKLDGIYASATNGMTLAQVKALVEPTQPGKIAMAGASFQRASARLVQLAAQLTGHAQKLAAAWGGANAPKVITQLQQLHETAVGLASTSQAAGSVLQWYGTTILPFYKSQIQNMTDTFGDKVTGFLTGTDPANTAAASQLAKLNTRIVEAYTAMPPAANKNLPPLTGSFGAPGSAGMPSSGRAGGGGYVGPVPASNGGGTVTSPVVGGPVIGGGHGTLAGFNPPSGGVGGGAAGGGLGIGGPGMPGVAGGGRVVTGPVLTGPIIGGSRLVGPGARGELPGAADPAEGEPGAGDAAAGQPGAGESVVGEPVISGRTVGMLGGEDAVSANGKALADGSAANDLGVAADPAPGDAVGADMAGTEAAGGPGFMPTGAGGQGGSERERGTWLTEDRDVWGDAADVTPPVIS